MVSRGGAPARFVVSAPGRKSSSAKSPKSGAERRRTTTRRAPGVKVTVVSSGCAPDASSMNTCATGAGGSTGAAGGTAPDRIPDGVPQAASHAIATLARAARALLIETIRCAVHSSSSSC